MSAGITESRCWPYILLCWGRPWASLRFCRTDALASTRASFWGSGGSGTRVASPPFGRWGVPGTHFVVFPNRRSRLDESFKMEVMGFLWGSPFCSLGMLDLCFCLWVKKSSGLQNSVLATTRASFSTFGASPIGVSGTFVLEVPNNSGCFSLFSSFSMFFLKQRSRFNESFIFEVRTLPSGVRDTALRPGSEPPRHWCVLVANFCVVAQSVRPWEPNRILRVATRGFRTPEWIFRDPISGLGGGQIMLRGVHWDSGGREFEI